MTPTDHGVVRIVSPLDHPRSFTGTHRVARPPRIGDIGVVVDIYSADVVAVECVDAHGLTLWLADFHLGELEPIMARVPNAPPEIDVELTFLSLEAGGRERTPDLGAGAYRSHLRVPPSAEMLGVQFSRGAYGQISAGTTISATVRPLHGVGVPYELLQPDAVFDVLEGAHVVARGNVTRVR